MAKRVLGKNPLKDTIPQSGDITPVVTPASATPAPAVSKPAPEEKPVILSTPPRKPAPAAPVAPPAASPAAPPALTAPSVEGGVSWRKQVDDGFGYEEDFETRMQSFLDFLYTRYFRVEVQGLANVPREGRVLLVANHAGMLPYDSLMIREALRREHPEHRMARPLLEDFVSYFPFLGTIMSRLGSVRACQENGQTLLNREEAALVFPEGIKGIVKPYARRYRLQRFGRGGFVRLAMSTRSPIVPVAVIGSEETNPVLTNIEQLAKMLGLPYLPVTYTFPLLGPLGLLPLPSHWRIVFGKPVSFKESTPDQVFDRILVTKMVERVRSQLQSMIDRELAARRSVWL